MFQITGRISPDAVINFQHDSASKRAEKKDVLSLVRRRPKKSHRSLFLMLLFLAFYVYIFIIRPHQILEQQQQENFDDEQSFFHRRRQSAASKQQRYLIFLPFGPGQGTGNIMHGLLAAHLLAMEFDRTVCVSTNYTEFHLAFHVLNTNKRRDHCDDERLLDALQQYDDQPNENNTITIISYRPPPPNEFLIKQQLASDTEILYFFGNTYPRWPTTTSSVIPTNLFQQHYKPTAALQRYLPTILPKHVVHLRAGDSRRDARAGLDEPTFDALGRYFQQNKSTIPYLITNRVKYYDWFASNYNWQHPNWSRVRHSAYKSYLWDRDSNRNATSSIVAQQQNDEHDESVQQTLQLFSDWYVVLNAEFVLHTHSDFSLSAIHWNNVDSKTIEGVDKNTGELVLSDEYWRQNDDEVMEYLVDRTEDQLKTT